MKVLTKLRSAFSSLVALMVLAFGACAPSADKSTYAKEVTIPPRKAHFKELSVSGGRKQYEISLKSLGGEAVDFAILRREDYEAYKADRNALPQPIISRTRVSLVDALVVALDAGQYLLSVHNHTTNTVRVTLKYRDNPPSP